MIEVQAYEKHRNLKLAAGELGIPWQTLYVRLKQAGVKVVGDKLKYGSDRDRLGAKAEAAFHRLVPFAVNANAEKFQAKVDFHVGDVTVDVKSSRPRKLSKKYEAMSWSFSLKKQTLVCDFVCCFCFDSEGQIVHIILVPSEFFAGLQTISVSCEGNSKWLDYKVEAHDLAEFFFAIKNGASSGSFND